MNRTASPVDALSDRERAVAEKFASGLTYREIGEALFIAPSTVRTHLAAVYEKLGVRNKIALASHFAVGAVAQPASYPPDGLPILAIFPIESLSPEERWRRFADGLSSDITIDLARYGDLPVIGFHTMKALDSKPADFAANGKALGATYILSGQLRADDHRIRLTIELADALNGVSLWSDRFDRPIEDVFNLQDNLTDSVINVLAGRSGAIATIGRNAIRRKPPASLRAYDLFLLGFEQQKTFSRASNEEAVRLFSRALELDPTLVRAWTELAYTYSIQACLGFGSDLEGALEKWRWAIENALQLDPTDCSAHACLGDLMACLGDLDAAERAHRRALEYGSNHADTLAVLAGSKALVVGDPAEAMPLIERALRLNPLPPSWYFAMQGRILFAAGRHCEAIASLRRGAPDSSIVLIFLAWAHAAIGEASQAAAVAARLRTEFPEFSVERFIAGYPVTNPDAAKTIRQAAKLAKLD